MTARQRLLARVERLSADVQFDPTEHTYTHAARKRRYPSVTTILGDVGFNRWLRFVEPERLEYLRSLGTAVHRACLYDVEGDLAWDSLDPDIRNHVLAFRRWRVETEFRPLYAERPLINTALGFAGTPDLVGVMGPTPCVVDLKSGLVPASTALQTAGYCLLIGETRSRPRRLALRLGPDGRFQITEFRRGAFQADLNAWRCALYLQQWRST